MTTLSVIQKSQLEGVSRLDAEYYQLEYLALNTMLNSRKCSVLHDLTNFVKKGIFDISPERYTSFGIPLVRVQNIKNGAIAEGNLVYITPEDHDDEKKTELEGFDLVFSKVGTVGEIAFLNPKYPKWNFSQNVIGAKIKKEKISPAYLLFFLLSGIGRLQIKRAEMFQVQPKLELEDVRNLRIVRIKNEDLFDSYLDNFLATGNESKNFYSQAENLLLEELGLKNFLVEDDSSFIINLSDVKSAKRTDSDFFQPKYEALISHFKKSAKLLKDVASRSTAVVKIDSEAEYKYIEISDINTASGEITVNTVMGRDLPANAKMKIYGGELLISKVRPTRGAVAIVPESWTNDYVASGAFSIFKTESPKREYLQVVMRSIIGKLQLEKPTTGTSYPTVTDQDVENILIPVISKLTQQKIADLVKKSHEARKKSKELLEEAKRKVEEIIEKGGEN